MVSQGSNWGVERHPGGVTGNCRVRMHVRLKDRITQIKLPTLIAHGAHAAPRHVRVEANYTGEVKHVMLVSW